jgi:hypothetical protein
VVLMTNLESLDLAPLATAIIAVVEGERSRE